MAKRTNSVDTTFFSLELLRRIPRSQRITAKSCISNLQMRELSAMCEPFSASLNALASTSI